MPQFVVRKAILGPALKPFPDKHQYSGKRASSHTPLVFWFFVLQQNRNNMASSQKDLTRSAITFALTIALLAHIIANCYVLLTDTIILSGAMMVGSVVTFAVLLGVIFWNVRPTVSAKSSVEAQTSTSAA